MILALCTDDRLGLCFNGRRQSRDSAVYAELSAEAAGAPIWVAERSAALFTVTGANIKLSGGSFDEAGTGEYCFVEFCSPASLESRAEKIIIYRWNRRYPADMKLNIELGAWHLESTFDFPGSSHEKITKEVYVRE